MYPEDLKYDKEHVWARVDGDVAVLGITDYAQDQLGDVVYVDLPSPGDTVSAGDTFGEVESVKSVSDLFAPVSGEVVKVNDDLEGAPETVNQDPYGAGWMIQVLMSDAAEIEALLSAEDYEAFLADEG